MNNRTRKALRDFYFEDSPPQSFEEWLYKDATLQKLFQDEYTELISLDFKNSTDLLKAREIIKNIYDADDAELLFKHKALETAREMLVSSITLERGCQILAKMRNEGMEFIPIHFVGYDSEFSDKDRSSMFDMVTAYSETIKKDCASFLNELNRYSEDICG